MFTLAKYNPEELKNSILARCAEIDSAISLDVPDQDIDGLIGKLNKLSSLTGTMAACVADAKKVQRAKELEVLKGNIDKGYTPSTLNKFIEAECGEEESLFLFCDRLKSGLTATMNDLVTLISLWKTELVEGNKEHRVYKKE